MLGSSTTSDMTGIDGADLLRQAGELSRVPTTLRAPERFEQAVDPSCGAD
jgi:hypothetical protein